MNFSIFEELMVDVRPPYPHRINRVVTVSVCQMNRCDEIRSTTNFLRLILTGELLPPPCIEDQNSNCYTYQEKHPTNEA